MTPLAATSGELSGRFTIVRELASGTSGIVYEALDAKLGGPVALKRLRSVEAEAIYRFKEEFRALADLHHDNLVRLHELFASGQEWLFSMELVRGSSFGDHIAGLPREAGVPEPRALRASLRGLASGLHALHRAKKLHRDLKPSNVIVTPEGRVVIVDLGLVAHLVRSVNRTQDELVRGTPLYMSPEQASGEACSTAADWYSFGVMLYEALTGQLPFSGEWLEVLARKRAADPPDPRNVAAGLPADLCELAVQLLARRPEDRPRGREVLLQLEEGGHSRISPAPPSLDPNELPFIGRTQERLVLERAYEHTESGSGCIVYLHGASGIGKTTLAHHFLEETAEGYGALVLEGRCHERESVPFKALDRVVDALTRHLLTLPDVEVSRLLPADIRELIRVFPVLDRIPAAMRAHTAEAEVPNPRERRHRAAAALRDLLRRIARHRGLVVHIDDVQWGDADSASLLVDLMRPPHEPALLLVLSYRTDEAERSELLVRLLQEPWGKVEPLRIERLEVGPLGEAEVRDLTSMVLAGSWGDAPVPVEAIVREARGSPLFAHELARYARKLRASHGVAPELVQLSLDDVLARRMRQLPQAARALLETVAVAGRPTESTHVAEATQLSRDESFAALAQLRSEHLVRTRPGERAQTVDVFHDQIRDAVLRLMSPDQLAGGHRRLGSVLEGADADPELLATHFREARDTARALRYTERAAERAERALAFRRAAELYRACLEMTPHQGDARLNRKLADALSNAGRGGEAGDAYLAAIPEAPPEQRLELSRRAAEQLLRAGHFDRGIATLKSVLARVGLVYPKSPRRALLRMLLGLLWLRLRGLRWRERRATSDAATLVRLDTCFAAGMGIANVDRILGSFYFVTHLILALRAGDPLRVARGLAVYAAAIAVAGGERARRAAEIFEEVRAIAERLDDPQMLAMSYGSEGLVRLCQFRLRHSAELFDRASEIIRDRCAIVAWEQLGTIMFYSLNTRLFMGDLAEVRRRAPQQIEDARERGDLYAATLMTTGAMRVLLLAHDLPEEAERVATEAMRAWSVEGFHIQHCYLLFSRVEVRLYQRDPRAAYDALEAAWPAMRRSLLLRSNHVRIYARCLRGKSAAATAAAAPGSTRAALLHTAEADARSLDREGAAYPAACAHVIRAIAAAVDSGPQAALRHLVAAQSAFREASMMGHLACVERRLGQLVGGDEGAELLARSRCWFSEQGVVDPERWTEMVVPSPARR